MLEYIFKAIVSSIFTLVTWLSSPLLALWPRRLPWFLAWFGQYDDDNQGSLDPGWLKKPWVAKLMARTGWLGVITRWFVRLCWLCRNPAQYLDYWILGVPVWDGFTIQIEGDPTIDDVPFKPGWLKKIVINFDGRQAWFYRRVFKWPFINRCCDIKLGYAVWDSIKAREKAKLVFTPLSFSKMED